VEPAGARTGRGATHERSPQLLDANEAVLGSLAGLVFVADALHTQTSHTNELAARGAHLLIPAKGNQPTLSTQLKNPALGPDSRRGIAAATMPTAADRTRTVKALTVTTPVGIRFPHAQQAVRITRTRTVAARPAGKRSTTPFPCPLSTYNRRPTRLGPPRMADRSAAPRQRRDLPH
jgi:hypothetical protein